MLPNATKCTTKLDKRFCRTKQNNYFGDKDQANRDGNGLQFGEFDIFVP